MIRTATILGFVLIITFLAGYGYLWSREKFTLLRPTLFVPQPRILSNETKRTNEIIGFLPYWNLKSVSYIPYDKLTTIYYFAIDIDGEGNFNQDDAGLHKLKSEEFKTLRSYATNFPTLRLGTTIVSLNADDIAQVVNSPARQKKLINNTVSLMKREGFQDLNFDFEYLGDFDKSTQRNYTLLVRKLTETVHKEIPGSRISFDTFADAVVKTRIFDIPEIAKIVDRVIIMGYDFHRTSSIKAGPIAPLFGKEKYEYEIYQSVVDYLRHVPNEKLILAVPFYGYEWPTQDPNPNSYVVGSVRGPEIASYKRSLETAEKNNTSVNFDDHSKSAWFSYFDKESNTFRQVWFENERSLGLKFDLINQAGLAGAAIWALGYDGENNNLLWKTVKEKLLPL